MSIQIVNDGITSDHADTALDGQPIVKFTVESDDTVANIRDISDIVSTAIGVGVGTHFVLSYDPNADNFVFISPDAVVESAAGSQSGPAGFDSSIITALGEDLDNKIDLDAGTWS